MKKRVFTFYLTILFVSTLTFVSSCKHKPKWDYKEGHFSTTPTNFASINTAYDDYNSALNQSGETFELCFSSNRKTNGSNFDIVYKFIEILYDWETRDLYIGEAKYFNLDLEARSNSLYNAMQKINTNSDEFGPFMLPLGTKENPGNSYWGVYYANLFLFSNDESGNQDIRFVDNQNQEEYEDSKPIQFLNSPFDDAYPSFNKEDTGLYFCSNRLGKFDIFFANVDLSSKNWSEIFGDTNQKTIQRIEALSSDSADKCPFILGNTIVFASNRAGGFGGFDLYYSKFENGAWGEPKNFGSKINTAADEYRPVIRREEGFDNDFMIFSSNRQGGKGGFDLYYVGVEKIPY